MAKQYTINDKLLFAVLGVPAEDAEAFEAQIAAERAARLIKDRAMAVAMAVEAARCADYGPAEGAEWAPSLVWGNPRATARVGNKVYCYLKDGQYYPLPEGDTAETSVFI